MKNRLLALVLFIAAWGPGCAELAHAGNGSGNVSSVKGANGVVAGSATSPCLSIADTDTSYITLHAFREGSSTNGIRAFYKDGVQYQVSSGKTFVTACLAYTSNTQSDGNFQLLSGTTAGSGAPGGTIVYELGGGQHIRMGSEHRLCVDFSFLRV